jgi:hypothetical protein
MPEYKFITYHNSVQRAAQYCCNDDDDGDHNESYERSEEYSPFRLR